MHRPTQIRELIYKRGFAKVNKQRLPISDNSLIEQVPPSLPLFSLSRSRSLVPLTSSVCLCLWMVAPPPLPGCCCRGRPS
jgi:hypothetical protein